MAENKLTLEEENDRKELQKAIDDRRKRFTELLGNECEFIDALVIHTYISPWDVKSLLDKGCPQELIPEILI